MAQLIVFSLFVFRSLVGQLFWNRQETCTGNKKPAVSNRLFPEVFVWAHLAAAGHSVPYGYRRFDCVPSSGFGGTSKKGERRFARTFASVVTLAYACYTVSESSGIGRFWSGKHCTCIYTCKDRPFWDRPFFGNPPKPSEQKNEKDKISQTGIEHMPPILPCVEFCGLNEKESD